MTKEYAKFAVAMAAANELGPDREACFDRWKERHSDLWCGCTGFEEFFSTVERLYKALEEL